MASTARNKLDMARRRCCQLGLVVLMLLSPSLMVGASPPQILRDEVPSLSWGDPPCTGGLLGFCTPGDCVAELHGDVDLQGRAGLPASTWLIPVQVHMEYSYGAFYRNEERMIQDALGTFYEFAVFCSTYDICVKGKHTLQVCKRDVLLKCTEPDCSCIIAKSFGTLPEGDANGDNTINAIDASILASNYWAGADSNANFNEYGNVDALDASLLASNYWGVGQTMASPAVASQDLAAGLREEPPEAFADIMISPPAADVRVGEVFTLTVEVDPDGKAVHAADVFLQFDPQYLQVVDGAGAGATEVVPLLDGLGSVIRNEVDPGDGLVAYAAMETEGAPTAKHGLFHLPLKALVPTGPGGTGLAFDFDQANLRVTLVAQEGYDVLANASGAKVTISEPLRVLALPLIIQL